MTLMLTDRDYILLCVIGSLMGVFLSLALFPPVDTIVNTIRRLALKLFVSLLLGSVITPELLLLAPSYMSPLNSEHHIEYILLLSFTISSICITCIHSIAVRLHKDP